MASTGTKGCRIATTSAKRAADALDVLTTLATPFAILHGSAALEALGATSDIDLVVAMPPALVATRLARALPEHDLHVIVRWNYDIGGATTLILCTDDAVEGVQLDMLFDVDGVGLDGLMTPRVLEQSGGTGRWPCANPMHELLYLIRKRRRKCDHAAVRSLVERAASEYSMDVLRVESFKIFRGPVARGVCALLEDASADPVVRRPAAAGSRIMRWGQRLVRPVGFWAECEMTRGSDSDVATVAETFARFMPYSRAERRPDGDLASLQWFVQDVMPVRWRPGLFLSATPIANRRIPRPDLTVERGASPREIQRRIVAAMASRVIEG